GSMSWTGAKNTSLAVMTVSYADQTTPANNGATAVQLAATNPAITVPTRVGDMSIALGWASLAFSVPLQTNIWIDVGFLDGGGSRGSGTTNSDLHGWTHSGAGDVALSACNLVADASPGRWWF